MYYKQVHCTYKTETGRSTSVTDDRVGLKKIKNIGINCKMKKISGQKNYQSISFTDR